MKGYGMVKEGEKVGKGGLSGLEKRYEACYDGGNTTETEKISC